jgi:hypothetical protein
MTSPLSYVGAEEHLSILALTAARERMARQAVPHRGRIAWLSRVFVELRRRARGEAPPAKPAHPAPVVALPGRLA